MRPKAEAEESKEVKGRGRKMKIKKRRMDKGRGEERIDTGKMKKRSISSWQTFHDHHAYVRNEKSTCFFLL